MSAYVNKDTASGLLVLLLGAAGIAAVGNLEIGVPTDMGPGYLPRLVAWLVTAGGVVLTGAGFVGAHEKMPPMSLRPVLAISAATCAFGFAIDELGMVIAVVSMTFLASLASPITRHRETPVIAVLLTLGAVLVFITALKLAIPIWPR